MCEVLWFTCPCGSCKFLISSGVITSTRTLVYRLHDQAEDETSNSLTLFGLGGQNGLLRVFAKYLKNGVANLYETM